MQKLTVCIAIACLWAASMFAESGAASWGAAAAQRDEYAARKLPVPADKGAEYVIVPATLKEAFAAGVNAEIENIAMYDRFLAESILSRTENAGVRDIFMRLRDASKSHLSAFQKALSRYRE
jgi:rubrerythrin